MTGILALSEPILCKKEVLGKAFEFEISGIKANLFFPQYPVFDKADSNFGLSKPLLSPKIAETWRGDKETLSWGYPIRHPEGSSYVELLALTIECEKERIRDYAQAVNDSIYKWEHALIDYLTLETKQNIRRDKNMIRKTCTLDLSDNNIHIPTSKPYFTLQLVIPDVNTSASEENINNALVFACSGKELLLQYQMLLSSYRARANNRNRQAILDACAAVELCLVNQITLHCKSIGLDPNVLLNKYRYLGDKFSLIKQLGINCPNTDYKAIIVDPRNSIMHNKSIYPSNETTDNLIAGVEEYLRKFHVAYY